MQKCSGWLSASYTLLGTAELKMLWQSVWAAACSKCWVDDLTQIWSQPWRAASCLGQSTRTCLALSHDGAQCVHAAMHYIRCNTSSSVGKYLLLMHVWDLQSGQVPTMEYLCSAFCLVAIRQCYSASWRAWDSCRAHQIFKHFQSLLDRIKDCKLKLAAFSKHQTL